jgi:hypothetical protein
METERYVEVFRDISAAGPFELERMVHEPGSLTLHLTDMNGDLIECIFDFFFAYRRLDEGDALKTLAILQTQERCGHINRVENSDFVEWFNAQNCSIRAGQLAHYSLLARNDLIDVIAGDAPRFVRKTNPQA